MDSSAILKAAEGPEIRAVFLDCFDTVVSRDVDGQYLKQLWAKRIRIAAGLKASSAELFALRVRVEADECAKNEKIHGELEFRFGDFAESFYKQLSSSENIHERIALPNFQDLCLAVEATLEEQHQRVIPSALELIAKLKPKHQIYLVSDFYHSSRTLRRFLQNLGISEYFANVFTSSDYLKTKRSSRLYSEVMAQLELKASEVLMIGDSTESDIKAAKRVGILAIQTPPPSTKRSAESSPASSVEAALSKIASGQTLFSELSFSLVLFCEALLREASNFGSRRLFFVSREGIFLKRIFDAYQTMLFGKKLFSTAYLRASRKATFLPSLSPLEHESFEVLFRQYRRLSIEKFIINLNLEARLGTELRERFGELYSRIFDDFPESSCFKELLDLPVFRSAFEEERLKQREALTKYLKELGCCDRDILLVDVGWKGSIQDNLRKVFPDSQRLVGLYLGLSINTSTPNSIKRGLVFDSPPINAPEFCFSKFLPIYEILCAAAEGSTTRYELLNGQASTVLDENENECTLHAELVGPVQGELFDVFRAAAAALNDNHFDNFSSFLKTISKHHSRALYLPTEKEQTFLRRIDHLENFGVLDYTRFEKPLLSRRQAAKNFLNVLTSPKHTLGNGNNPLLACSNLGIGWLQGGFGEELIASTFGNTSGLNISRTNCMSRTLCRFFNLASRARALGDYR